MYYTYVLECVSKRDSKLYIGSCLDLRKRIKSHVNHSVQTTKKFRILKLVYYEACICKKDALKREKQLKTGFGRGYIKRRLKDYFELRV